MGSASKSSSRTGSAQKWAKPFAIAAANDVSSVYDANQASLGKITGQVQGLLPGLLAKYNSGNPMLNAAQGYAGGVLAGNYLNGNSYLNGMIDQTASQVANQVNSNFGSRGSFGGTAHTTALASALAAAENNLRYQNYGAERANQQAAMAAAPQFAAADYLGITPLLAAAQTGAELPYAGVNALSGNLAGLFQGGKSTEKTSMLGSLIGAAGQVGATVAMSDRRVKENIERIGELPDGLGIYRWNFVWGPARFEGVMADEVAVLRPWALGPELAGYMTVNYGEL